MSNDLSLLHFLCKNAESSFEIWLTQDLKFLFLETNSDIKIISGIIIPEI